MTRTSRELVDRMRKVEETVDQIVRSIERIEVATIVRDPASTLSADAYDGLRRQVIAAAGERMAHLHQLARFAEAVAETRAAQQNELAVLVREWMAQAGLERVDDPRETSYYDVLGGDGTGLRILRPAYRDGRTGRAVLMGQAERCAGTADTAATNGHREVLP